MASRADGQTLAPKEASVFRQVIRFYESKQYKKGIKAADQVCRESQHAVTASQTDLVILQTQNDAAACLPPPPTPACMHAPQVLKKNPDHGETLAMKGLIINCQNEERKDEAFDLVKRGLKHNLKSHVCWHVLGCAACLTATSMPVTLAGSP